MSLIVLFLIFLLDQLNFN